MTPAWSITEHITTAPDGRPVRVRIEQRVTIEYLDGAAGQAVSSVAVAATADVRTLKPASPPIETPQAGPVQAPPAAPKPAPSATPKPTPPRRSRWIV
jgi:hypothetical protein